MEGLHGNVAALLKMDIKVCNAKEADEFNEFQCDLLQSKNKTVRNDNRHYRKNGLQKFETLKINQVLTSRRISQAYRRVDCYTDAF